MRRPVPQGCLDRGGCTAGWQARGSKLLCSMYPDLPDLMDYMTAARVADRAAICSVKPSGCPAGAMRDGRNAHLLPVALVIKQMRYLLYAPNNTSLTRCIRLGSPTAAARCRRTLGCRAGGSTLPTTRYASATTGGVCACARASTIVREGLGTDDG